MARRRKEGIEIRGRLWLSEAAAAVWDGYTPEQRSEVVERAIPLITPGVPLATALTAVVRPARPCTKTVVRVFISGSTIQALFTEYPVDAFQAIAKKLRYTWEPPFWSRKVAAKVVGDRAAELVHRLLEAGFPVQTEYAEIRDRAIAAEFEPEHSRVIAACTQHPYAGWFELSWPRDDDLYEAVTSITASKYIKGAGLVRVPPEHFAEVEDLADQHDFWFSPEAMDLLTEARQNWQSALIAMPRPAKTKQRQVKEMGNPAQNGIPQHLLEDEA